MRAIRSNPSRVAMTTIAVLIMLSGCDRQDAPASSGSDASSPAAAETVTLPDELFLETKPDAEPTPVTQVKASAKEGDEVVMRVVVGGRVEPFVSKRAIMTVVDAGMKNQCTLPSDPCETPWDYCCEAPSDLKANMATVEVVDGAGMPLKADLGGETRLEPLSTITVVGKVGPRPDPEALVVTASGIFVEPAAP